MPVAEMVKALIKRRLAHGRRAAAAEAGQSIIIVVIAMSLIVVMAAFVISVSTWQVSHHQAQVGADAAALAAADCLANGGQSGDTCTSTTDTTDAVTVAEQLAAANGVSLPASNVTFGSGTVTVVGTRTTTGGFAGAVGVNSNTQSARSVATLTAGTSTNATMMFAMSNSCTALTLNGTSDTFNGTLWSNGGIKNTGSTDSATAVDVGNTGCGTPGGGLPAQTGVTATSTWPVTPPSLPSSCPNSSLTITTSWLTSNPSGIYCATGNINFNGNLTVNGYEFISEGTQANSISITNSGDVFVGYGTSPQICFWDPSGGGISVNNPAQVTGDVMMTGTGNNATIQFNGQNETENGVMEAQSITINNNGLTWNGGTSGVTSHTAPSVSLSQ